MSRSIKKIKTFKIKDERISYMALVGLKGKYNFPQSQIGQPGYIESLVCKYFDVDLQEIRGFRRYRQLVIPRQIIMFLLRRYTKMSLKGIGKLYHKDHATVIHSITTVLNLLETDADYRKEVLYLEAQVEESNYEKPQLIRTP